MKVKELKEMLENVDSNLDIKLFTNTFDLGDCIDLDTVLSIDNTNDDRLEGLYLG